MAEVNEFCVGGRILNGIKNMHVDREVCLRINGEVSEWFNINSKT